MTVGTDQLSPSPSLVCVTGASGYVGSHVVRELLERGYRVRATVRDASRSDKTEHLHRLAAQLDASDRFEIVELQLLDAHSFDAAFAGCESLCHVASVVKLTARDPQKEIIDPAVEGTRNALQAAQRAGIGRVVLTSSIAAIIDGERPRTHSFTEADWNEDRDINNTPYMVSKAMAERTAWALHESLPPASRFSLVTINPTVILGPVMARSHLRTTPGLIRDLLVGKYPGLPNMSFSIADVRDVATAHRLALEDEALEGRFVIYNEGRWMRELADLLRETWPDRPIAKRVMPNWLMYVAAFFDKRLNWRFLRRTLGVERRIDNRRSREVMGLQYRPLAQTVLETGKSLERLGYLE